MSFARFTADCAELLVDGDGDADDFARRIRVVFAVPSTQRWPRSVALRATVRFGGERPRVASVAAHLACDPGLRRAWRRHHPARLAPSPSPRMWPTAGRPSGWAMPPWTSFDALAAGVGCPVADLRWLAGGFPSRPLPDGQRHHYRYRWIAKATGGDRLVEQPKDWLKAIQRRILAAVVARLPAHDASHGYVVGRSARTFALPHVGTDVVVRLDLVDFFPSVSGARVRGAFATAGFPPRIAGLLTGLCTNRTPRAVVGSRRVARERYTTWHLPQGAPTSPGLANACCYRLDCRLAGLARSAGAAYTRYADDLVFSGDRGFAVGLEIFLIRAHAIVIAEGFELKQRKTRIMRRSARQRIGGLVVNERVRCPRADRERLEAILVNCGRTGPRAQNRAGHPDFRAHLRGRIAWVAQHDARDAAPLHELFARIRWDIGG